MSKKTLEFISHNVITSESLVEKIKDLPIFSGKTLVAADIKRSPIKQKTSLNHYFHNLVEGLGGIDFNRNVIYKPIPPQSIGFIYSNYGFLTDLSDKLILLRTSINRSSHIPDKNLINIINSSLNEDMTKLDKNDIITNFEQTELINSGDLISFIEGEISNASYRDASQKIIDDITEQRVYKFLVKVSDIISEKLNLNIMFIMPAIATGGSTSRKSLILSNFLEERPTLGIVVSIPSIHQASLYKHGSINSNTILYDNIFELDFRNNRLSRLIGTKITKNIIIENGLSLTNKMFKNRVHQDDVIEFEPLDRYQELSVIQLEGPDNNPHKYLLGIYGNLYEDDDNFNDLVGRLRELDTSTGKSEVFWCQHYYNKLKN